MWHYVKRGVKLICNLAFYFIYYLCIYKFVFSFFFLDRGVGLMCNICVLFLQGIFISSKRGLIFCLCRYHNGLSQDLEAGSHAGTHPSSMAPKFGITITDLYTGLNRPFLHHCIRKLQYHPPRHSPNETSHLIQNLVQLYPTLPIFLVKVGINPKILKPNPQGLNSGPSFE
ncbi:hypothetical protein AQUCO_00300021v1 [Aquilegia coerulea]|uniref:Uncharacterized protein n=1 Tax=Aquilegia coerulea TaxID=218851 RepID=A0A2G5EWY0_AQUCA|nr:hypothetical protein AQUCO_00300021v1 [Aquilegia coerulea]